ncbi:TetR/AcrR family transcriptional regulator [uncultured Leifsonia sp.]|uniref:TetR/AcrR family transcriptional regulator n=1 Tax=uncultured Leifsonia sp. TaxID=340359 RepID=UPI0025ECFC9C|nr:TetR/AcrR family transcriptional regulator [Propionicimonas sp.]
MRPSKRTEILDAALGVIEAGGVTAVTFEAVAEAAGMTKGGLLYHFGTREVMLQALHEHLAEQWETALTEAAGKPAERASDAERLAAYAQVATRSATRAELLLMLETVNDPAMHAPWNGVLARWTPPLPEHADISPGELSQLIARLAADGLWLIESLTTPLHPSMRARIANHLTTLAYTTETPSAPGTSGGGGAHDPW